MAPVETVKTKVIELNKPFIEGFKYIVRTEGIRGVYQGVRVGLLTDQVGNTHVGLNIVSMNRLQPQR